MDAYFQPTHLLAKELDYELRIRNVVSERNQQDKRKILSRLLQKERQSQFDCLTLTDPKFEYDAEKSEIDATLESIKLLVNEFEGPSSDSSYKRAKSRILHVLNRIQRLSFDLSDPDHDIKLKFKNESYASCLHLDAELHERVQEPDLLQNSPILQPQSRITSFVSNPQTGTSVSELIPVYKLGVTFDGNPKDALSFIERIEERAVARHISKSQLFESASDLFTGNAIFWLRQVKSQVNDWDSLVSKLKLDFLNSDIEEQIWSQIKSEKQGKTEPVIIFIARMEALFHRLDNSPAERTKIKYIKLGIHAEYRKRLALQEINTVKDLSTLCKKLEEAEVVSCSRSNAHALNSAISYSSQTSTTSEETPNRPQNLARNKNTSSSRNYYGNSKKASKTSDDKDATNSVLNNANQWNDRSMKSGITPIKCWNCGIANHFYRDCKSKYKNKFCKRCGTPEVTVKTCTNCNHSEN